MTRLHVARYDSKPPLKESVITAIRDLETSDFRVTRKRILQVLVRKGVSGTTNGQLDSALESLSGKVSGNLDDGSLRRTFNPETVQWPYRF